MYDNLVITIGRECGSGGRKIGQMLAERLGIKCYDKELLALAAKQSGLSEEVMRKHDERPTNSFLYTLVMDTYSASFDAGTGMNVPMDQKVFLAQFDCIRELAEKESCVIVGRCADYVLESYPNLLSVFTTAKEEDKLEYVQTVYDIPEQKARDFVLKTDKKRSSYYNYYTNKRWGWAENYDLCLNRSALGFEGSVEAILSFIELKKKYTKE